MINIIVTLGILFLSFLTTHSVHGWGSVTEFGGKERCQRGRHGRGASVLGDAFWAALYVLEMQLQKFVVLLH